MTRDASGALALADRLGARLLNRIKPSLAPTPFSRNSVTAILKSARNFANAFPTRSRNVAAWQWTQLFTRHPASVGETYLQHLRTALGFGVLSSRFS